MTTIADVESLEFLALGESLILDKNTNDILIESNFPNIDLEVEFPSSANRITEIITPGVQGIPGTAGSPGVAGAPGPPGPQGVPGNAVKFSGIGPPGLIIGAIPGDTYLDTSTGDIYILQ